ncbi:MAG: hypothetical protein ACREMF_05585 [Gemmatimonadales bacterium]
MRDLVLDSLAKATLVLVAVARHATLTAELRRTLVEAANRIGSDYERTRVLAAIGGRAELD